MKINTGLFFKTSLLFLLVALFADPVFAQQAAPATAQPSFGEVLGRMLPLFFIVFFIFYFLVIRPQDKKLRQQSALIDSLKKGDQVVTSSGVIGRVSGVETEYVLLEISNNVRMKVMKTNIASRFEPAAKKSKQQEKKSAAAA